MISQDTIFEYKKRYILNIFCGDDYNIEGVFIGKHVPSNPGFNQGTYYDFIFYSPPDWQNNSGTIMLVSLREGTFISDGRSIEQLEEGPIDSTAILTNFNPKDTDTQRSKRWKELSQILDEAT